MWACSFIWYSLTIDCIVFTTLLSCPLLGFFRNAAKKDPQEGYRTLVDAQMVSIHPSSSLFHRYVVHCCTALYWTALYPGNQSGWCSMRWCRPPRSTSERLPPLTPSGWWSTPLPSSSSPTLPSCPSSSRRRGSSLSLTSTRNQMPGESPEQGREGISVIVPTIYHS